MQKSLPSFLRSLYSRKLILTVIGILINLLANKLGISQGTLDQINPLIVAYIGVQGLNDIINGEKVYTDVKNDLSGSGQISM